MKSKPKRNRKQIERDLAAKREAEAEVMADLMEIRWSSLEILTNQLTRRQAIVYRDRLDRHIADLEDTERFVLMDEAGLIGD